MFFYLFNSFFFKPNKKDPLQEKYKRKKKVDFFNFSESSKTVEKTEDSKLTRDQKFADRFYKDVYTRRITNNNYIIHNK